MYFRPKRWEQGQRGRDPRTGTRSAGAEHPTGHPRDGAGDQRGGQREGDQRGRGPKGTQRVSRKDDQRGRRWEGLDDERSMGLPREGGLRGQGPKVRQRAAGAEHQKAHPRDAVVRQKARLRAGGGATEH